MMLWALLAAASPAMPACLRAETVPGFEAWAGQSAPVLEIGRPAELRLAPASAVNFSPPLERRPGPGSRGGVFALAIRQPGTYAVALSAKAWIEITDGKARVAASDHGHAPICSGIAKIVSFRLEAQDYVLQLSNTTAPTIRAMVIKR